MNKTVLLTGILFGVLAIILGAFGAHGLRDIIGSDKLQTFETGIKYQMYHALFLLVLGNLNSVSHQTKKWVYFLITIGVLLFSFSIYLLATNSLTGIDFTVIGILTPIGGVLLILGWLILGYRIFKQLG